MNEKLNIDAYLAEVNQAFSGVDATPYNVGYEGDLGFSGANGVAMVAAPRAVTPSPYQISVSNTTAGILTLVLFGKNQYLLSTNFGSAAGLTITPSQVNVSYLQLLNQSAEQPFETSLIRVQADNNSQVTQILTITSTDANGQTCTVPVITQSYFSANQFQAGIVDVPYAITIDGNTSITTPILGGVTATYTFFPAEKVNTSKVLRGRSGQALTQYAAPTVPIVAQERPSSYPSGNQFLKY